MLKVIVVYAENKGNIKYLNVKKELAACNATKK